MVEAGMEVGGEDGDTVELAAEVVGDGIMVGRVEAVGEAVEGADVEDLSASGEVGAELEDEGAGGEAGCDLSSFRNKEGNILAAKQLGGVGRERERRQGGGPHGQSLRPHPRAAGANRCLLLGLPFPLRRGPPGDQAIHPNLLHAYVLPSSTANEREVTTVLKLLSHTARNFLGVFFHSRTTAVLPVVSHILPFLVEPAF